MAQNKLKKIITFCENYVQSFQLIKAFYFTKAVPQTTHLIFITFI